MGGIFTASVRMEFEPDNELFFSHISQSVPDRNYYQLLFYLKKTVQYNTIV